MLCHVDVAASTLVFAKWGEQNEMIEGLQNGESRMG